MIAFDTSGSMEATDVDPTRFVAAQRAALAFVDRLPERFNTGLVSFSGSATVAVPPTTDRAVLRSAIEQLTLGQATAIGDAVIAARDAIRAIVESHGGQVRLFSRVGEGSTFVLWFPASGDGQTNGGPPDTAPL
jgi:Mg-chelatase subunit ChlD